MILKDFIENKIETGNKVGVLLIGDFNINIHMDMNMSFKNFLQSYNLFHN